MTNHTATANALADRANRWSVGDLADRAHATQTGVALATEGVVHALLAVATELRDLRGDLATDRPPLVVYRAAHESIGLGLYTNREAARDHCVASARESGLTHLGWVTEADDDTDTLHDADNAVETGYTVHPLDVADEYDADAE